MKRLLWIGSSYDDLMGFPGLVRGAMGHALYFAQIGKKHEHAKVLSGMGNARVLEVRENDRSGTYRVIYTIEMDGFVFVCMLFRKNRGRASSHRSKRSIC